MDGRQAGRLGCGLLLLLCFVVAGAILYQKYSQTAGPEEEANSFLRLLAEGKEQSAYADAARSLRTRKTPGMLALEAQSLGIKNYASSSWRAVHQDGREATLEGAVTTRSKEVIPLVVKLVHEDRWRVQSIAPGSPGRDEHEGENSAASADPE